MNSARKERDGRPGAADAPDPWISLVEAASQLEMHRQTVMKLALRGEVEAKEVAGRIVVTRASVAACKARQGVGTRA